MLRSIISWLVDTIGALGYPGIVLLMALESSFFPFPSEVVMVPAGYLASQGKMHLLLATLLGILGSILGAWFNYEFARRLGRPAILRWGRYLFLSEEKLRKIDRFFFVHGEISTFLGRLIPGIRQYISLPAGLTRMDFRRFTLWTAVGSGLWVTILTLIGYTVGANQELVEQWSRTATFWLLLASILIVALYWKWRRS